ncbi:MAG: proline--tRNA ligase [Nanoarchaeota archaeon]|nr:proline--tRNA ligase [Nanoarchaeota archaeon]
MNEIGITVKKEDDMPEWYSQVVLKSGMADYSAVKGCAVIRPLGYAIWQNIMDFFNERISLMGVENAYFPMFIPESFFHREAQHVDGFAPEVAWVEQKSDTNERIAVRPTSEAIMYDSYAKWIRSHRDLPLRINQWCNIVRWEVSDVKIFLRSREFLWQEGHCVYATEEECQKEVLDILEEYRRLVEELLAIPVIKGEKSEHERFPGAKRTYTIESFMPDGKALQAGTSHNLGQGFAKAFNITFQGTDEKDHHPWQSSWGFSTRLLGAMVMQHSDDKGLVLPPRVAPTQAVIIPITIKKKPELSEQVLTKAKELEKQLKDAGVRVKLDDREEYSPGFKYSDWELKGVPIRIEVGPRDIENNQCILAKRNDGEKSTVNLDSLSEKVKETLEQIHQELFDKAKKQIDEKTVQVKTYDELKKAMEERKIAIAHHCGDPESEDVIKAELGGVTTRCRPMGEDQADEGAVCVHTGKPAKYKVIFSKNY